MKAKQKQARGKPTYRELEWLEEQNLARKEAGLPLLKATERKCLQCDSIFVSAT
jgi:hypothetical protein